ncbi:MAG TPA: ABC transporter permease [Gemmatimonadales bacterium]|jgi:predicted permease|nr:ABC transporter permease [Gemmatimonadales bacterium]
MSSLLRRVLHFFRRRRFERELKEELHFHEEMAVEDAQHRGADAEEARFAARRRVGNDAQIREEARAIWSVAWLEGLGRDLRYAARALRRRPAFALASTLTLALGIGATTALWSVLDPVLLRPLPYRDAPSLVALLEVHKDRPEGQTIVSPANLLDWRERNRTLQDVAIYTWSSATLGDEPAEELSGRAITTNLLRLLGAAPMLGRGFAAEDTLPNAPRALLISHALWRRRFGGDPSVVGKPLHLRDGPALVIGVMPPDFRRLGDEEYWVPFPMTTELRTPWGRWVMAIGRLKPGITAEAATAELRNIARGLALEHPRFNAAWTARAVPLAAQITGKARPVLWLLAGAIGFVLIVACANVANLHLGQAIARRGELAIRSALGASRVQVIRQWLVEGLVLAAAGGALGVGLAAGGVHALVAARVSQIPRLEDVGVDLRVLAFAGLVTVLAGLGFGLAPALVVREGRLRGVLTGHSGSDPNPKAGRLRAGLVVAQVALCFILLVGAGLAIRSLGQVLKQDLGLDASGVLTFRVSLPSPDYPDAPRQLAFFGELARRAAALPGVRAAGLSTYLPLAGIQPGTSFRIVGDPERPPGQGLSTQVNEVDAGYFSTFGIPILRGRGFGSEDRAGGRRVVVVSRTLARVVAGDGDPLGRQLKVSWREPDSAFTIVGIAGDVRVNGLDTELRSAVYFVSAQSPSSSMALSVRTAGNPLGLVPALRGVVAALDRGLPVVDLSTMEERIHRSVADRRYPMALLALLGALALALAAIGLYGVLAYAVTQRQREIGVRRAIGASDGAVLRLVIGGGFRLVALGLLLGLAGAVATTRFLGRLLFEISPTDPATLGVTAVTVALVALAGCALPARRAARVDPVIALRGEG